MATGSLLWTVCFGQHIRILQAQHNQGVLAISRVCGLGENDTEPRSDPIGIFSGGDTDLSRTILRLKSTQTSTDSNLDLGKTTKDGTSHVDEVPIGGINSQGNHRGMLRVTRAESDRLFITLTTDWACSATCEMSSLKNDTKCTPFQHGPKGGSKPTNESASSLISLSDASGASSRTTGLATSPVSRVATSTQTPFSSAGGSVCQR